MFVRDSSAGGGGLSVISSGAPMHCLVIDNYDSFTFNLVQVLRTVGGAALKVTIVRNDKLSLAEAEDLGPTHLVISPGPGAPSAAGMSKAMIGRFAPSIPVLGVCLGHQAMMEVFGGRVVRAARLMHGKASIISHDGRGVFAGLPAQIEVGRYHSLLAEAASVPADLLVSATTAEGEIMGLRHRLWPCEGVQFHPESVLTPLGERMLANFLAFTTSAGVIEPGAMEVAA